jgi:hypothetical protein
MLEVPKREWARDEDGERVGRIGPIVVFHNPAVCPTCGAELWIVERDERGRIKSRRKGEGCGHVWERPEEMSFDWRLLRIDLRGLELRHVFSALIELHIPAWEPDLCWLPRLIEAVDFVVKGDWTTRWAMLMKVVELARSYARAEEAALDAAMMMDKPTDSG